MLKKLLKNKEFKKIVRNSLKKSEILDIILFGSVVRGKEDFKDIDILVLVKQKGIGYDLRKEFEKKRFEVHVVEKTYEELIGHGFLAKESVFLEGYSLRENDFLASAWGFKNFVLFRYFLKGKNNSERMKFYYSLYGRGGSKGVLNEFNAFKFSDGIVACSVENVENVREFFSRQKIKADEFSVLLPERIASKKFLEIK